MIATNEIDEANRLLAANSLQWRWRWLPSTVLLAGAATLHAAEHRAAV